MPSLSRTQIHEIRNPLGIEDSDAGLIKAFERGDGIHYGVGLFGLTQDHDHLLLGNQGHSEESDVLRGSGSAGVGYCTAAGSRPAGSRASSAGSRSSFAGPTGESPAPRQVPQGNLTAGAVCRELVRRLRRPLVSTSANISGEPTPQDFNEISEEIKSAVDYVVPKPFGAGATGRSSQIIKLGLGGEVEILRP